MCVNNEMVVYMSSIVNLFVNENLVCVVGRFNFKIGYNNNNVRKDDKKLVKM